MTDHIPQPARPPSWAAFITALFDTSDVLMTALDREGRVVRFNRACERATGYTFEQLKGRPIWDLLFLPEEAQCVKARLADVAAGYFPQDGENTWVTRDGRHLLTSWSNTAILAEDGTVEHIVATGIDITERKRVEEEREQMELELRMAQKLASGIAHEISTPVQFVGDSVHFLRECFDDLDALLEDYRKLGAEAESARVPASALARVREREERIDLADIREGVPEALGRTLEGVERISSIVKAMKDFSHAGCAGKAPADLNDAIETTLALARHEYRYVADVTTELGELEPVTCIASDLNQVFLNLIINAAHAIEDTRSSGDAKGHIRIRTSQEGEEAVIEITDTGEGVPDHITERIFDPFFTTKEIGRGSGQGLAISRSIVVDKHGGSLIFKTQPGQGTTFKVRLPLGPPPEAYGQLAA